MPKDRPLHPIAEARAMTEAMIAEYYGKEAVERHAPETGGKPAPPYPRSLKWFYRGEGIVIETDRASQMFALSDSELAAKVWNELAHPGWGNDGVRGRC